MFDVQTYISQQKSIIHFGKFFTDVRPHLSLGLFFKYLFIVLSALTLLSGIVAFEYPRLRLWVNDRWEKREQFQVSQNVVHLMLLIRLHSNAVQTLCICGVAVKRKNKMKM
jgi:hypothetical protein